MGVISSEKSAHLFEAIYWMKTILNKDCRRDLGLLEA